MTNYLRVRMEKMKISKKNVSGKKNSIDVVIAARPLIDNNQVRLGLILTRPPPPGKGGRDGTHPPRVGGQDWFGLTWL